MLGLTARQHAIAVFIEAFTYRHGYAPSYREIRDHFGLASLGSVYKHIQALIQKGALKGLKGQSRSLAMNTASKTIPTAMPLCRLPLIGYLQAGSVLEKIASPPSIAVPTSMVADEANSHLLRVADDSLHEELIANGDLLIVENRSPYDSGETIVGIINDCEVLVKKYHREKEYVRLEGYHAQHTPMIIHSTYIAILGVLKGVMRVY